MKQGMRLDQMAAEIMRRHVGRRVGSDDDDITVYTDETLQADDRALQLKMRDTIRALADPKRFENVLHELREAAEGQKIERPAPAVEILSRGPDRVVVNRAGEAVSPKRARERHGFPPDIVFIRRDGWTLGAPFWLESVAFELWPSEWIGFIRRPARSATPIAFYTPVPRYDQ